MPGGRAYVELARLVGRMLRQVMKLRMMAMSVNEDDDDLTMMMVMTVNMVTRVHSVGPVVSCRSL